MHIPPSTRCLRVMIIALFLSGSAVRARAEVVPLSDLEAVALRNRPVLQRDAARTQAAAAELRKAQSAYHPHVVLKGDTSFGPGRQLVRVGSEASNGGYLVQGSPPLTAGRRALSGYPRSGLELSANATLYDFGRTHAATEAGRDAHTAALAGQAVTREELLTAVRHSYLGWLLAHELLQLSQRTIRDATARKERVEALVAEGVRPQGELAPARADELLARLEHERAAHEQGLARLALEQAVGASLPAQAEPDATLLEDTVALPDASAQEARRRQALLARLAAAKTATAATAALNRPELTVGATVGLRISTQRIFDVDRANAPDPNNDRAPIRTTTFPLYGAGLTLTVPLWDGGFTRAASQAAAARAAELKAELAAFEAERHYIEQKARLDSQHAAERLGTALELVSVCAVRLNNAEAGYEAGVATLEQIAQARSLLRRAETEALLARVDQIAARMHLTDQSSEVR